MVYQWYESKPRLVNFTIDKNPSGEVKAESQYELINGKARVLVTYTIDDKGVVKVVYALKINEALPNIPKVGMTCGIANDFRQISWYGRGLQENYTDRRYGFDVGLYYLPMDQFMEPYVKPQENGNRTDVRWMYLSNQTKKGLLFVADSLLSMSAWPYNQEAFKEAKHLNEMKESGYVTLNIDLIQMGVGGNDSWSAVAAPLEKYQIKAKDYTYCFYLCPMAADNEKINKIWNQLRF